MIASDAAGVARCIERCYGTGYPKRVMYEPDELARLVRTGAYNGVVAAADSQILGHIGFTHPTPASTVVEAGTTVVDPAARGMGLMGRLGLALGELVISENANGFIHFPTTAHHLMQRASLGSGGRETGLMLAYLPPEARDLEIGAAAPGRLAVTIVYQPLRHAPHQEIHLPHRYRPLILELADRVGLSRTPVPAGSTPSAKTVLESTFDASRDLQRITIGRIGADVGEEVAALTSSAKAGLVHVDLPMSDPSIEDAVEQLRRSSFAFAGWLPGWRGYDVLRLQYLAASVGVDEPTLYSAEAAALMNMIRAELLDRSF